MSEQRLRFLFHRYFDKTASAEERAELMALLGDPQNDEETHALLEEVWQRMNAGEIVFSGAQSEAMLRQVLDPRPATEEAAEVYGKGARAPVITLRRAMAAAVVLLVAGVGVYFQFYRHAGIQQSAAPVVINEKEEIDVPAPNGNNAILTLADGSTVVLDSARNGTLTQQGDAQVSKANAGRLVYNVLSRQPAAIVYNTVSTQRGGQYQIVLPDGSKVWLNTVSSLRFPTAFAGAERVVELTGEAYFEVAKQDKMPFRVHVNAPGDRGMDVRVLGTHFDVMAYDNEEEIRTTLLEGAVKVVEGGKSSILAPGQQVKMDKHGGFKLDENADVDLAMAWKNGFTSFKSADIKSILRQVERWYDIDVMYEGNVPERKFSGGISRDANLSEVIRLLEVSKIHFKIKGRKLTVTP
jgi:ferric-dicitrate binding protein FerR (iron transport regulator)